MARFKIIAPVVENHLFYIEADDAEAAWDEYYRIIGEDGCEPDKIECADQFIDPVLVRDPAPGL